MKIAILDDDPVQLEFVSEVVQDAGYRATLFSRGQALISALRKDTFDMLIVDWNLPDRSGLEVLAWARTNLKPAPPMLLVTSRAEDEDVVAGLDAGADDYLVKPYDPDELLARLRAVERRRNATQVPVLSLGELQIDLSREQVRRAGVPMALTQKEWALLRVMATRPERIHTRESLQDALYGFDDEADSNTLEVFISRLRRKLGREHIETLRGLGYRLVHRPDEGATA